MEKNLIAIFILFLLSTFSITTTVYKQATLQANLLGNRKFMKDLVRFVVVCWSGIIFLYICCFLDFPVIDKTWLFLTGK